MGRINSTKHKERSFAVYCPENDEIHFVKIFSANKLPYYVLYTLCQIVLLKLFRWPRATYVQFRRPEQRSRNNDRLLAAQSEVQTPVGASFSGPIQTDPEPQPPVQ